MDTLVSRRQFVMSVAGLSVASTMAPAILTTAQARVHRSDTAPFTNLELPTLEVTVTNEQFTVSEAKVPAGRYLVTLKNRADRPRSAAFLQLGDEITIDTVNSTLTDPSAEPPIWLYTLPSPGGVSTGPGSKIQFIVDLPEGTYAVHWNEPDPSLSTASLIVTGTFPVDPAEIEATVTVDMADMAFDVSGALVGGQHVVQFANTGEEPHEAYLFKVPNGTTEDDFIAFMAGANTDPGASPVTSGLSEDDLVPVFQTAIQSPGTSLWVNANMAPATYALTCFVVDPDSGMPHAMTGMTDVFVIE